MSRYDRRMYRQQNPLRAVAALIFFIFLIAAFTFGGPRGLFLPIFFVGMAIAALVSSISSFNPWGIYGGLVSFVWLLGVGIGFLVGFWPWLVVPIVITIVLGAIFRPIIIGLRAAGSLQTNQQQPQPATYEEGGNVYPYPPQEPPPTGSAG